MKLQSIILIVVLTLFSCAGIQEQEVKEYPLTFKNCAVGTWVGGVRWLNDRTDYEDVPGLEMKGAGVQTFMVPEGDYAITHFWPGIPYISPSAILDFVSVVVDKPTTLSFGCENE